MVAGAPNIARAQKTIRTPTIGYLQNGVSAPVRAGAHAGGKSENRPNGLLEQQHGEWLDTGTARQAEAIRRWQPWKASTGPKTAPGKARSAGNAWKGGTRPMLRQLARALANLQR